MITVKIKFKVFRRGGEGRTHLLSNFRWSENKVCLHGVSAILERVEQTQGMSGLDICG